jgi:hypothetical protein
MTIGIYQPLAQYPTASLKYCNAAPTSKGIGGKSRWRLCFDEPDFDDLAHRVAAKTSSVFCLPFISHDPFNVYLNNKLEIVWIHRQSLCARFKVPDDVFNYAVENGDLSAIFNSVKNSEEFLIAKAKTSKNGSYISARHYGLKESIYVCGDLIAYKILKSLIHEGGNAKVKKARMSDGTMLARRVVVLTPSNRERVVQTIKVIHKFKNNPRILQCLGVCSYTSRGRDKVVMLYLLCDGDLLSLLQSRKPISDSLRIGFARQFLEALHSLDGIHGDLMPPNVLFKGNELFLHDLEYYQDWDENKPFGSKRWAAPEILKRQPVIRKKVESWPAGMILYYLFSYPNEEVFPWHPKDVKVITLYNQEQMDNHLCRTPLSDAQLYLVSKMLRINPTERFTIKEALDCFNKHISPT